MYYIYLIKLLWKIYVNDKEYEMGKKGKGKEKIGTKKKEKLSSYDFHETNMSDSNESHKTIMQIPSLFAMDATISIEKIGEYWENKFSELKENLKLDKHESLKIIRSMACPFSGLEGIEWTIQPPIELNSDCKPKEKADPYSIISYHKDGVCKKNIIYGGNGECIVQVDLEDHGKTREPHFHILIPGVLDHTSGVQEGHSFSWKICPWLWLLVPVGYNVNTSDDSFKLKEIPLSTKSLATNRIEQLAYSFNEWCIQKIKQLCGTSEQKELLGKIILFSYIMLLVYANDVITAISFAIDNIENSGLEDEDPDIVVIKKIREELKTIRENAQHSRAASISDLVKPATTHSCPVPDHDVLPSKKKVVDFFKGIIEQDNNIVAIDKCISQMASTASKARSEIIDRPIGSSWPPLYSPITTTPSTTTSGEGKKQRLKMQRPSAVSFFTDRNDTNSESEQRVEQTRISREEVEEVIEMLRKNRESSSSSSSSSTSYQP